MSDGWCLCQVVVSNSLAALSGSSAGRIYCDNLNVSACPLTEASKKVTRIQAHSCTHARAHRWHARTHLRWNIRFFTSYSIFGFSCVISFSVPVSLSVLCECLQLPRSPSGVAGQTSSQRLGVHRVGRHRCTGRLPGQCVCVSDHSLLIICQHMIVIAVYRWP